MHYQEHGRLLQFFRTNHDNIFTFFSLRCIILVHNAFITMELTVNILNLLVQCNLNLIIPADFLNL